jgi:hypothetical protein
MYISGHLEILDNILAILPNDYFNHEYENVNVTLLKHGMKYPDNPCGIYDNIDNKHVMLRESKLCKFKNIFKLFNEIEYGESQIFQVHLGFFSHVHSMSTSPENNMLKIRNKILMSIIGYALLSVYDKNVFNKNPKFSPNIFWIGIILHCITDSYSPAHTIRGEKTEYTRKTIFKERDPNKIERLKFHENIKTLAKKDSLYSSRDDFYKDLTELSLNKFPMKNQYWKIYKLFKFEYDCNKLVKNIINFNNIKIKTKENKRSDITAFQYYGDQSKILHLRLDFLNYVKNNTEMYDRMMIECIEIMNIYKEVLETQDVNKFINKLFSFLFKNTYNINKKYLKNKTNKIINI